MEKSKRTGSGIKIGKFVGILLILIGCGMFLFAAGVLATEGAHDYFSDALSCLFGLPGIAFFLSGIRILRRKRGNVWIILAGVAFGMIGFGVWVSHYHADVSDINQFIAIDVDLSGDPASLSTDSEDHIADGELYWYDSVDEAMQDDSLVRDAETYVSYRQLADPAGMTESDGTVMAFYGIQNDDDHLAIYYYRTRNGKYSQPYRIDKPVCADNPAYHYDLDDSVCERITDQYVSHAIDHKNEEISIFWGLLER